MLLTPVASLLVPFLGWLSGNKRETPNQPSQPQTLQLELRHLHAVSASSAHVVFSDVTHQSLNSIYLNDTSRSIKPSYSLSTRSTKTYKPSSFDAHSEARLRSLRFRENLWLDWLEDEIIGPDVEKRETLLELAKMTNNAYVEPEDPAWYELGSEWNVVC